MTSDPLLRQAAEAIAGADALLIAAGAGMGVDSGLPDFRGDRGFWNAYPAYDKLGLNFVSLANPHWFDRDPALAWGFYGHRLSLYRSTSPHAGFQLLRTWAERLPHGAFVFTSNVDGHFQRAGFAPERIMEVHGSIDWLQCLRNCGIGLFAVSEADEQPIAIDEATMRARPPLPACPSCGGLARPNILMFGDWTWNSSRTTAQQSRLEAWLEEITGARLVILECGAGTAVPTVRRFDEELAQSHGAMLIRINVREPTAPPGHIGLALGALDALHAIDGLLGRRG
jgi:NAD-dependent SIR2 family protein deacetylase